MNRPMMPAARGPVIDAEPMSRGGFDLDLYHAMSARDDKLVEDELLHGSMMARFVYEFTIQGKRVTGISVVGARHLAAHYGGIKHRLVASAEKKGALFIFQSFPAELTPMSVQCSEVRELEQEPDFYSCVVEVTDIKRGLTLQVEKREHRFEETREGKQYERPHFQLIAQSKGFRNAILSLVPQDVVERFKTECLRLGKSADITASVIDERRDGVIRFAAKSGMALDRDVVGSLTFDQISGLGDAAREGVDVFVHAARALGLAIADAPASDDAAGTKPRGGSRKVRDQAAATKPADAPKALADDSQTPPPLTIPQQEPAAATQPPPPIPTAGAPATAAQTGAKGALF